VRLLFLLVMLPSVAFAQDERILKTLDKIDSKLDNITHELSGNSARLSALETWKEQQAININRFYEINYRSMEDRLTTLESNVQQIQTYVAGLDGKFEIFSFIAFLMNLTVPATAAWFFNRKWQVRKTDMET
jgi:hypothetical protein